MNELINQAIQSYELDEKNKIERKQLEAECRIIECFGTHAKENLLKTSTPCHFRIKNTSWDLVYGFFNGFTIWHKDYPPVSCDTNHPNYKHFGKYCAWQIVDMRSLGESLDAVIKRWGV